MKIKMTDTYVHHQDHPCLFLSDCDRLYCGSHRLLYRCCETAEWGVQGDNDVVGGVAPYVSISRDCPTCELEAARKRMAYRVLVAVN